MTSVHSVRPTQIFTTPSVDGQCCQGDKKRPEYSTVCVGVDPTISLPPKI